jgi:Ni2+-binding GTPase involved in maturation of urease and hydrogenase
MDKQNTPTLIFVGGFLGSGKTTLILKAAEMLEQRGKRVAYISNDQDAGRVDTRPAEAQGVPTREIAGECFCCRFSDLMDASDALRAHDPDVIFAEPVGSCTDLSATILQPLKTYYRDSYRLSPLTVLMDPSTAEKIYRGELSSDIEFLFRKQLGEADMVCLSKQDVVAQPPSLPFPVDFSLSAKTGFGMEEWLAEVLEGGRVVGARLLEIDYARYAAAEAALGWVNLHAQMQSSSPISPAAVCGPLLERLKSLLDAKDMPIAHLKVFDQGASGWVKASISSNGWDPVPEGDLIADPVSDHELAINLRAVADPDRLRAFVEEAIAELPGEVRVLHLGAFRPGEPRPEHRFHAVQP